MLTKHVLLLKILESISTAVRREGIVIVVVIVGLIRGRMEKRMLKIYSVVSNLPLVKPLFISITIGEPHGYCVQIN